MPSLSKRQAESWLWSPEGAIAVGTAIHAFLLKLLVGQAVVLCYLLGGLGCSSICKLLGCFWQGPSLAWIFLVLLVDPLLLALGHMYGQTAGTKRTHTA